MCFVVSPEQVEKILSSEDNTSLDITEDGACQGLLMYAEALAGLAESEADPGLSLESEMKLAGKLIAILGLFQLADKYTRRGLTCT
jgi:hypothetical protein